MPHLHEIRGRSRTLRDALRRVEAAMECLYDYRTLLDGDVPPIKLSSDGWEPLLLDEVIEALDQIPGDYREGELGDLLDEAIEAFSTYRDAVAPREIQIEIDVEDGESVELDALIDALYRWLNDEQLYLEN